MILNQFSSNVRQMFREVTAIIVNNYCSVMNCTLVTQDEIITE